MKKSNLKILLIILIIIIIIGIIFLKTEETKKRYCNPNTYYQKIDETTGVNIGGRCYCPTDKISPLGNPEAEWIYMGDNLWMCIFVT